MRAAKRLARRLLPDRLLRPLRGPWHRVEELDPRLLARRRAFRRLSRSAGDGEIFLRPGLGLRVDARSREPFEWYCFRSLGGVRELDLFLHWAKGRHRLLDVGASHGLFSLAFTCGRSDARALAVEPSPVAWGVLTANLARNPGCQVTPLQVAAGRTAGEIAMRQVWHHLEALAPGEEDPAAVTLRVRPLDELCAEHGFRPDLVKIDVEGFELAVLEGAAGLLTRQGPPLFLELHPRRLLELAQSARQVHRLLSTFGYRLFRWNGEVVKERHLTSDDATLHLLCLAGGEGGSSPWGPEPPT